MEMQILLQYKELFPEEIQPKIEDLLGGIGRDLIFEIGAFFLSREHTKTNFEDCFSTIDNFFSNENSKFQNRVYAKAKKIQKDININGGRAPLIIVSPIASLSLFEHGSTSKKSEIKISHQELEIRIFKAYLLINEFIVSRDEFTIDSVDNVKMPLKHSAQVMSIMFPTHDIVNVKIFEILMCQFIKSFYLFEYLESAPRFESVLQAFYSHYGISSWKEFIMKMLGFAKVMLNQSLSGAITFEVKKGELFESDCRFLRSIALGKRLEENTDFIYIRSNPIYEIRPGVFRVIYRPFFFEVIYRSLYFRLNHLNNSLPDSERVKGFRSIYCDEFSERTMMNRLLIEIFGNRFITRTGEQSKSILKKSAPDFYIRNGKKIFLFESKDFNFSVSVKQSGDWQLYEDQLKKRFYGYEAEGKLKRGAILQLFENINRILLGLFTPDPKLKNKNLCIYSIILVHHRLFSIPGLNACVKHWFNTEMQNRIKQNPSLDYSKIRVPVVIDIDTLIIMKDLIESKKIHLEKILDGYLKYIDKDLSAKFGSLEETRLAFEKANYSFKQYFIDQSRRNNWNTKPNLFRDSALKFFN
jgi:hypothetical protein